MRGGGEREARPLLDQQGYVRKGRRMTELSRSPPALPSPHPLVVCLHPRTHAEVGNVDDFARTHRELVVAGVGLAVAVPSLIGASSLPFGCRQRK